MGDQSTLEIVHEIVTDLHEGGFMTDEEMRHFDFLCKGYTPEQIRQIRKKTCASRDDFARHLHVSARTLKRWESGQTKPGRSSQKLLDIIDRNGLEALEWKPRPRADSAA